MEQEVLGVHRERRVRRVEVSLDLILDLMKIPADGLSVNGGKLECTKNPIPESAKVIGARINNNGEVELMVEDASFDAIGENDAATWLVGHRVNAERSVVGDIGPKELPASVAAVLDQGETQVMTDHDALARRRFI